MTELDKSNKTLEGAVVKSNLARRRFLGKGAAAAPFVLTLASQPALGVTCYTPSRSLSKNTSISQQGKDGQCLNAESPGNYKAQQDSTGPSNSYHWPAAVPPSTPFHPLFLQGSTSPTSFQKNVSGVGTRSMTLGEVLTEGAGQDYQKVAKYLIGAYLNTMGGNGAIIPVNVMTPQGILNIWASYAQKGFYEVTAGVTWDGAQIKAYLKSNGIVA
jgi:hypothetical protein